MTRRHASSSLVLLLTLCLLTCGSALSAGGGFFIDWRTLHAANIATLWSTSSRGDIKFDGDFQRIGASEYLALMTAGGLGGDYARTLVVGAISDDPAAPSVEDWVKMASGELRFRKPAVVGLSHDAARTLALQIALRRSDDPATLLGKLNASRFASPDALAGLLYSHALYGRGLTPMIVELAPDLNEDDRVFPLVLAARDSVGGPSYIAGKTGSESSWERAVALLALANNPKRQEAGEFYDHAVKAVDTIRLGNNWVLPLVACAIWMAGDRKAMTLLDPFVRDADEMLASFAAIPAGGHWSAQEVAQALDDPSIPSVVKSFMLMGAAKRNDDGFGVLLLEKGLMSPDTEIRKGAALALGLRGDPNSVLALKGMFQDASYDVRACSVIAAAMLKTPHAFGIFKTNALDKHHMEVSALASILAAFQHGRQAARITAEVEEYIFDRERGVSLLALAVADPESFSAKATQWRNASSPYLRRYLALGGLSTGDPSWLRDLHSSVMELQDYQPFGSPDTLRKDAVRTLMPEPFSWLLDYCMR